MARPLRRAASMWGKTMDPLARTPSPPYYAVVFTSVRTDEDETGYAATADRMVELAAEQPGFLGIDSARAALYDLIDRHGFGTLVTALDGAPFATHLPFILDRERGVLLGHVARANPQRHALDGPAEALAIFQGPHGYVSPSWYRAAPAV